MLDLEPSQIGARLQHARVSPVAITAGPGIRPHLSVLVESGSEAETRVAAGLGEDELRALLAQPGGIADLTTYTVRGARQYAVVVDPRAGPSLLFTGVTAGQLRRELRRSGATVVRLRAYVQGGQPLLAAVARALRPRVLRVVLRPRRRRRRAETRPPPRLPGRPRRHPRRPGRPLHRRHAPVSRPARQKREAPPGKAGQASAYPALTASFW
jgi:hypothetical protein